MSIFALLLHTIIDFLLGNGILSLSNNNYNELQLPYAILVGLFFETIIAFLALWLGLPLHIIVIGIIVLSILLNIISFSKIVSNFSEVTTVFKNTIASLRNLRWYEWFLLLVIFEKIVVIIWQLFRMPVYHSDAIKHWATSGRAIFSGVNWNLTKGWEFLGQKLELVLDYPLQLPIWRAITATLAGGWNDTIARGDGLLFFILVCVLIGVIFKQLTNRTWAALGAVLIIASLPLQVWQAASGYVDLAVEVYVAAAIIAFIRKEWWLCGIFAAGAIWSKNDGLAIFLPGILLAGAMYHIFIKGEAWKNRINGISQFVLGLAMVSPWLLFQALYTDSVFSRIVVPIKDLLSYSTNQENYQVILVQVGKKFEQSPPSYELFWEHVFIGSTHGIFWLVIFVGIILLSKHLIIDRIGRSLLVFFITTCFVIYYVFTYTPAYEFLLIQTTVHRTLLQFSAAALVVLGYGMSLTLKKETNQED